MNSKIALLHAKIAKKRFSEQKSDFHELVRIRTTKSTFSASKRLPKLTLSVQEGIFGASEIHLDFGIDFGREKVAQITSKMEPESDRKSRAVFFSMLF